MSAVREAIQIPDREGIFVDNEWTTATSSTYLDIVDPATEETLCRVKEPSAEDVDGAVASARRALEGWSARSPEERAEIMERIADGIDAHAQELADLTTAEVGTPVNQAGFGPMLASWFFRYYAGLARTWPFREDRTRTDGGTTRVLQEPVGVVAGISPWNGPVIVMALKMAPAMAAGCTGVMKAPPTTPAAMYRMAEIFAEAGLPAGVVNVMAAEREISQHLSAHPDIDKISFTGSVPVGKQIMTVAAERLARVTLELGGKSAAIIADDAPLESVLPSLIPGGCQSTGQACIALSRVLVSERRHDELVAAMKEAFEGMKVGDPWEEDTVLGPLSIRAQLDRVAGYVDIARQEGAAVVTGGGRPDYLERGFYYQPTLLGGVNNSMRVAQEEIFGPVISVIPYRDIDDAVAIANDTTFGLCGSVYTADPERGYEIARRVRTGMITVNSFVIDFNSPFGGMKCSGQGREGGPEGLAEFLEYKTIHMA